MFFEKPQKNSQPVAAFRYIALIFQDFYVILCKTFFQHSETIDIYAQNARDADRTLS